MSVMIIFVFAVMLLSAPAYAYVGPGVAVAFVGYIFGPIIAIAIAVGLILIWPARWLYKKYKKKNSNIEDESS